MKKGGTQMNITSAQAAKLLKKLSEDLSAVEGREKKSSTFNAALGEDVESVRPEYDFGETQTELSALEEKIRRLKHAINIFNTTHTVPEFGMTIDEMLVYIPQLTKRKNKLGEMRAALPKKRVEVWGGNRGVIDYAYANYDPAAVSLAYDEVCDALSRAQLALDRVNSTETFEFDED